MALSLDNHLARKTDDYAVSASLAVALAKAALGVLPGQEAGGRAPAASLKGVVINVNFPIAQGQMLQGLFLARQVRAAVAGGGRSGRWQWQKVAVAGGGGGLKESGPS